MPGGVYVLDEPATGLHLAGVERLLGCSTGWSTPASRSTWFLDDELPKLRLDPRHARA